MAAGVPLTRVFHIVSEATRREVENPAARALAEGVVVGLANHTVLISRDGTERPIDDSAAPIRGTDGGIAGCVFVFRDVTDRKRSERAEREANGRVVALMQSLTEGFCVLDREYRFVCVNAAAERINGTGRGELLGRTQWEAFPQCVGTALERELRRAMAERVTVEFENHYAPWDRWFAVKAYPAPDGGICVLYRDITDAKRAQLERGRRRYAEHFDNAAIERRFLALFDAL